MPPSDYPIGLALHVVFPNFEATLTLLGDAELRFEIADGPFAHSEVVSTHVIPLGNGLFVVSWREDSGATVTHVQDFDRQVIHSHATLPDGRFLRMTGPFTVVQPAATAADDRPARNKALVLEAMTSLFQRHDASAVRRLYAPNYIQHNPTIPQGRDALETLVEALSPDVVYEPGLILAEGDRVAIHGRIRGWAETTLVVVDLFRIQDGRLAEHWDVLQPETLAPDGVAGVSMFDPGEVTRRADAREPDARP